MITISFTYDKVTPESAEQGDFSDNGFYQPGGWFYSMNNEETRKDILENPDDYRRLWWFGELRDALKSAIDLGIYEASSYPFDDNVHGWWTSVDPNIDYQTGEETHYSLHVEGCTRSTMKRIHRILNGRDIFDSRIV